MLKYPNIDPVIFDIYGPFKLRWYSLGYVVGIGLAAYCISANLMKRGQIKKSIFDDIMGYATAGAVVGGRLFYVLFYNLGYYMRHPLEAFALWDGGMSFHGGLIGVILAMKILSIRCRVSVSNILDLASIYTTFGLFAVRIANFINGELYGRPSNVWCSFVFPHDRLGISRHPSQLYEALGEGCILFVILYVLYKKTNIYQIRLGLSSLFLILYGAIRFCIEFTREPDVHIGFVFGWMTMGQVFCVIMILVGLVFGYFSFIKRKF